jgi:hypothetical protein
MKKSLKGLIMTKTRTKLPLKDRLEKHIIKESCWILNLKTNNVGYPVITIDKKTFLCHRVAYEIYHGLLRIDLSVDLVGIKNVSILNI